MVLRVTRIFTVSAIRADGPPDAREEGLLDDAGRPMPFIDRAVYSLEEYERSCAGTKFLQGYYDNSGIEPDSFDQAVQFGSGGEASLTESMIEKGSA